MIFANFRFPSLLALIRGVHPFCETNYDQSVCVCVCVRVRVRVRACAYACACMCVRACMHAFMSVDTNITKYYLYT